MAVLGGILWELCCNSHLRLSYVAYPLSTRHVEELILERGVHVDRSTINRWVSGGSIYGRNLLFSLRVACVSWYLTRRDKMAYRALLNHIYA